MEQKESSWYWAYILLLFSLFGLLLILGMVVFPHHDEIEIVMKTPDASHLAMSSMPEEDHGNGEDKNNFPATKPAESTPADHDGTNEFFSSLRNKYQTEVINKLGPGKPRTDIIIRYYQHSPDGRKVYSLRDLGFYIHERPVDPEMASYESNAIYYGDSVKREDILIVAYTLLEQGIPIKNISRSKFHDGWKATAIEVGTDTTILDKDILSLQELRAYSF